MIKPRIGCYAVYEPPEEGWENWEAQFLQVCQDLQSAGLETIAAPEAVKDPASCERVAAWAAAQDLDLLHALVITWSFDHYTIQIQQHTALPVAVRSIPGIRTGSLVGGEQLNCVLTDLGSEHRLFFGPQGSAYPRVASTYNNQGTHHLSRLPAICHCLIPPFLTLIRR